MPAFIFKRLFSLTGMHFIIESDDARGLRPLPAPRAGPGAPRGADALATQPPSPHTVGGGGSRTLRPSGDSRGRRRTLRRISEGGGDVPCIVRGRGPGPDHTHRTPPHTCFMFCGMPQTGSGGSGGSGAVDRLRTINASPSRASPSSPRGPRWGTEPPATLPPLPAPMGRSE